MRLIYGLGIALILIIVAHLVLGEDLKGYLLGAFGIVLGAFIYFSWATTTASNAIEYTDPHAGASDIIFDVIRTSLLIFVAGFLMSKVIDITLAGRFNIYMMELFILFITFSYVSFWELKHTVHHTLKAMFMLDRPKKFV
ncbi:MAG: hypothetical protein K0U38_05000 [Epsilonproteobacteria bacterium]|nr:hypothetical protein [Campylobacterota bacterium]